MLVALEDPQVGHAVRLVLDRVGDATDLAQRRQHALDLSRLPEWVDVDVDDVRAVGFGRVAADLCAVPQLAVPQRRHDLAPDRVHVRCRHKEHPLAAAMLVLLEERRERLQRLRLCLLPGGGDLGHRVAPVGLALHRAHNLLVVVLHELCHPVMLRRDPRLLHEGGRAVGEEGVDALVVARDDPRVLVVVAVAARLGVARELAGRVGEPRGHSGGLFLAVVVRAGGKRRRGHVLCARAKGKGNSSNIPTAEPPPRKEKSEGVCEQHTCPEYVILSLMLSALGRGGPGRHTEGGDADTHTHLRIA